MPLLLSTGPSVCSVVQSRLCRSKMYSLSSAQLISQATWDTWMSEHPYQFNYSEDRHFVFYSLWVFPLFQPLYSRILVSPSGLQGPCISPFDQKNYRQPTRVLDRIISPLMPTSTLQNPVSQQAPAEFSQEMPLPGGVRRYLH